MSKKIKDINKIKLDFNQLGIGKSFAPQLPLNDDLIICTDGRRRRYYSRYNKTLNRFAIAKANGKLKGGYYMNITAWACIPTPTEIWINEYMTVLQKRTAASDEIARDCAVAALENFDNDLSECPKEAAEAEVDCWKAESALEIATEAKAV